jgi:hypothetical protein
MARKPCQAGLAGGQRADFSGGYDAQIATHPPLRLCLSCGH